MRASGQDARSKTFFSPERPTKASNAVYGQSAGVSTSASATFVNVCVEWGNRIKLRLPFTHCHHSPLNRMSALVYYKLDLLRSEPGFGLCALGKIV